MIELLSPVGDFDCLKAAVQNGADAVYFGGDTFSARAFAKNFDDKTLEKAITYAKIRGVKTNLTLNTLIKNNELQDAIELAKKAYQYGIGAIIVQDLGLASYLIKHFPNLAIHASTQLSVHNLEGVLKLQELGFSRVVLARELSLQEIEYICQNSNVEIEVFVHGALCISYSGQCLFSSMIGGRSGNRGKCAQPCRLPYELIEESEDGTQHQLDKGYLLSPRDLCGLEYLSDLKKAGVSCLKIEGRMKSPEYVATVTKIYKKYLDLETGFKINEKDKKDLLQVFNRGGFSSGHLVSSKPNKNLVYPVKPNNMGIFLGNISNFNANKGHISFTTADELAIGDKIAVENKNHEMALYTISELMINNKNVSQAVSGDKVKIGRMKGKIFVGNKIYKMSDKHLSSLALDTLNNENRKTYLNCKMILKKDIPVKFSVFDDNGITIEIVSSIVPEIAVNAPITKERLVAQISKTNNTPFHFKNIEIDLDDGLYIPGISNINELRRQALAEYEENLIASFRRTLNSVHLDDVCKFDDRLQIPASPEYNKSLLHIPGKCSGKPQKVSILLTELNANFDYSNLANLKNWFCTDNSDCFSNLNKVDNVYIPFKYFVLNGFENVIKNITENFNTYIYMPTIIRNNYNKLIKNNLPNILHLYNIKGFVLSNIGNFELLKDYQNDYEFICNYTFNAFNNLTVNELPCSTVILSPELGDTDLLDIIYNNKINNGPNLELIVRGRIPLMNSNYCLLGKTNKCDSSCSHLCNSSNKYYIKDRFGFLFRVVPDNIDTVTTIYNSKITSLDYASLDIQSICIFA